MSQPKQQGSTAAALSVAAVIVISLAALGYYQYVYYPTVATSSTTSATGGCAPPSCVKIAIAFGAASLTNTAYAPDTVKLVIGVNNTIMFFNNDSQGGGVVHTATANSCPQSCPFDSGILNYGQNSTLFTIKTPGTYDYHCSVHPTTMRGTVVVVAGSGATSSSSSGSQSTSTTSLPSSTSSSSSSSSTGSGAAISIVSGASSSTSTLWYSPATLTVVIGVNNTVIWTNNDPGVPHTVTSDQGAPASFDSGIMDSGKTFSFTFTTAGTYSYHCSIHPWMHGTVIVKA